MASFLGYIDQEIHIAFRRVFSACDGAEEGDVAGPVAGRGL